MTSISRRDLLIDTLAGATAAGLLIGAAEANSPSATSGKLPTGTIHDFDFFVGNWESTNRRLRKRWVGSNDWETFRRGALGTVLLARRQGMGEELGHRAPPREDLRGSVT